MDLQNCYAIWGDLGAMIVYVNVKDGKVEITKAQLESLLKDEYDRGYNAGKNYPTINYSGCPYGGYWNCPYRSNWSPITWSNTTTATGTTVTLNTEDTNESINGVITS